MEIKKGWKIISRVLNNEVEDGVINKDEFVEGMLVDTDYSEKELKIIFNKWWELDPIFKLEELSYSNKFKKWFKNIKGA